MVISKRPHDLIFADFGLELLCEVVSEDQHGPVSGSFFLGGIQHFQLGSHPRIVLGRHSFDSLTVT